MHLPERERDALRQRVLREARAAARVSHQRLVTIFDVVEEEGIVFLVQELVDAPTLKALVRERGPLPPNEVAAIGRQLVDGLAAAHRNGVVHRDVKPSNVMVLPDGSIKLADFGIASLHGDPQITATGVVVGSPAYMAPEQAVGNKAGPPADLWSVGATLYFAVEGEPPFGRADTISTLTAVVNEPHREMVVAGPLAPLLARLLAKDPAARPDAAEVSRLLAGLSDTVDRPTAAMTEVRSTGHVSPPLATTVAAAVPPAPVRERTVVEEAPADAPAPEAAPAPRRRGLAVATAVVLLLLVGGFALAAVLGRGDGGAEQAIDEPAAGESATEAPSTTEVERTTEASGEQDDAGDEAPATTAAPTTTAAPKAAAPAAAAVPAGWKTYTDPKVGYTVAHPAGWRIQARDGTRTDFTDPATGTYLRVDWTDTPGASAQADWERQSVAFGQKHPGYEKIAITPTTFQGSDNASLWEYKYRSGGATLHAYNLGFVLGDDYGFALNFQSREENWSSSQQLWEQLKAGYRPPQGD